MSEQLRWNERYQSGDIPWDTAYPSTELIGTVKEEGILPGRALELGCGSGHSLRYLAERGARELWGIDLSPVQVAFAEDTLR